MGRAYTLKCKKCKKVMRFINESEAKALLRRGKANCPFCEERIDIKDLKEMCIKAKLKINVCMDKSISEIMEDLGL